MDVVEELVSWSDCAVQERGRSFSREDAVFVEQRCCGVIWQWFQRFSALRWLPFQLEVLQEDSDPFLSVFLELLRCSWRHSVFVRGVLGLIFGGGPFGIWFLGFVRGGEFRWSADFQLIPARGSAPSSLRQFLPAAGMQFL